MIKLIGTKDGRTVVVLGMTFADLDKFRDEPRGRHLKIEIEEAGLPLDVVIFSGESAAALADFIADYIGPDVKVWENGGVTPLSPNLQRKFERLTPRQQAALTAYRDALNTRADWVEAVCAAMDAGELVTARTSRV